MDLNSTTAGREKYSGLLEGQERRRYFRLNDRLGVSLKLREPLIDISEEALDGAQQEPPSSTAWQRQFAHWDAVLDGMETELNHNALGVAVKALRQQVKLLSEPFMTMEREKQEYVNDKPLVKEVNISACGLALYHQPGVKQGSSVSVSLFLGEHESPVVAEAKVIAVEPRCSDLDYLRLDFDDIDADNQERLIQYLVRRQSEQLRENSKK